MGEEWIRDACWEFALPGQTDEDWQRLFVRVAAEPERFWASVKDFIAESEDEHTARLYGGAVVALLELGGDWPERIAATARHDRRLAWTVEDVLMNDRQTYELLGHQAVIAEWVRNHLNEPGQDRWASGLLDTYEWLENDERWSVIIDLARAAPDERVIAMVGVGPIEAFLMDDWQAAIERIERDAPRHEKLRQALWSVWQLSNVPPSVIERVYRAANQPAGKPHRF